MLVTKSNMTEPDVLDLLERVGAFRKGHFVLTHGRHTDTYINKDAMYPYTRETSTLCLAMAQKFRDSDVDAVIGPAVGAAILSQWVAYHLSEIHGKDVLAVYADKDGVGGFILKRGYNALIAGKRVIVIEDLMTTGGSVRKVIDIVRANGSEVVGVGVVCNRGNVTPAQIGNPPKLVSLVNVELDSWEASECALCERKIPINQDIGHGREFVAKKDA